MVAHSMALWAPAMFSSYHIDACSLHGECPKHHTEHTLLIPTFFQSVLRSIAWQSQDRLLSAFPSLHKHVPSGDGGGRHACTLSFHCPFSLPSALPCKAVCQVLHTTQHRQMELSGDTVLSHPGTCICVWRFLGFVWTSAHQHTGDFLENRHSQRKNTLPEIHMHQLRIRKGQSSST
jgi:hypothetical protein